MMADKFDEIARRVVEKANEKGTDVTIHSDGTETRWLNKFIAAELRRVDREAREKCATIRTNSNEHEGTQTNDFHLGWCIGQLEMSDAIRATIKE